MIVEFYADPDAQKYRIYLDSKALGVASFDRAGNRSRCACVLIQQIKRERGGVTIMDAQINKVTIVCPISESPDIVGYVLYVEIAPAVPNHDSPAYKLGNTVIDGRLEATLNDIPELLTLDGTYNLGVAAVDDAGNESSLSIVSDIILDFVPPKPPGLVLIERSSIR